MANMFRCVLASGGALILTVTCGDSGFAEQTITCTDGTTTLTQTCPSSSPYTVEFKIPNAGIWTVSATISGTSYSESFTIPSDVLLSRMPDGSTVTPTDDIQTWLHCANIWDKDYSTISQVLADGTTVTSLIANTNAVDYMARSTTWASDVCADSSAMTKIGANNYCADELLSNSTWLNAICNSTYFESVLNVKVPTMTSNTTPSGVCSAQSVYQSDSVNYREWWAFDGNNSTEWLAANNTASGSSNTNWLQYKFPSSKLIKKVYMVVKYGKVTNITISGSNNGTSFTQLYSESNLNVTSNKTIVLNNNDKYSYLRATITQTNTFTYQANEPRIATLQFYGRETS